MFQEIPAESLDNFVTAREAADMCGVGVGTIHQWVRRGHLTVTGLDERSARMYRMIDVLRCARDTRRRAIGMSRTA